MVSSIARAGVEAQKAEPRLSASPLIVDVTSGDYRVIDDIADEWRDLCAEGPNTIPSYRPEWLATYLRTCEPRARVVLVAVRRHGHILAVLPLVQERTLLWGVPVTRLRAPNWQVSPDPIDVILRRTEDRSVVTSALWQRMEEMRGWDVLDLADVPEGGAMFDLIELAHCQGHQAAYRESRRTPYVPMPTAGGSFEQAIAHTGTKFRANVARRMRNLERTGPVRLVRTEEADPAWLDRFFTLEATGWKGRKGSAIACDPKRRAYYEALAAEAARHGYLTLYALECDGEPIAMHFGLTINGRYLVPKLAYDETRHEFGPGHLLIREILRDCVDRGLTEFDFLGDTAPWKREWAPAERTYYHVYIFGSGAMGRLAHAVRFRLLPTGRRIQGKLLLPFAI